MIRTIFCLTTRYTYGKPVKGEALVTLHPKSYGYPYSDNEKSTKMIKIDGKGYIEFDLKEDIKLEFEYMRTFDLDAEVTEDEGRGLSYLEQNKSLQHTNSIP